MTIHIKTFTIGIVCLCASFASFAEKIGVISALPEEQRNFLEKVDKKLDVSKDVIKGVVGRHTVFATLSGIGKVNAASVAQELISKYEVDTLLFTGVAGGIDEAINIGDIVVASSAFQHDYGYLGDSFRVHATGTMPEIGIGRGDESMYFDLRRNWSKDTLGKIMEELSNSTPSLMSVDVGGNKYTPVLRMNAVVATGDQFIANESTKASLRKWKADVVEMEGAAVAQVARKNDIPLLIIRSVSDKAGEKADIDFKSFFFVVAYNNSVLLLRVIDAIP